MVIFNLIDFAITLITMRLICFPYLLLFLLSLLPGFISAQNGLNFDGGNDVVQTTYGGVLGSANRTFEAWINVNANISSNSAITDYGLNAVGSRNTFLVTPTYQLRFISGGTNANIASTNSVVPPGQWAHVAFVLNNGTGFLYVNGVQVGTGNLTTVNTPSGNANMTIGQRVSGGIIPFDGSIDEVRIWDVARTQTEIQSTMNTEFCLPPTNLRAYYKFNHGVAGGNNAGVTTAMDNSGNGNSGTLSGFTLSGATSNWVTGAALSSSGIVAGVDTVAACTPFISPGNQTITTTGVYQDTVVMASGCDSIYTLDFTALPQSSSTINPSSCLSYTSPAGNVYTSSGTYSDTLANSIGCDSIITVNLTILTNTLSNTTGFGCDSFVSPSGKVWNLPGTYNDTIPNMAGCDSIMTINVVLFQSDSTTITASGCGSYTSGLGNTYTMSGTYMETGQTANGCDSTVTLNLTITTTDTSISQSGSTLTANQSGVGYQWFDCDNQVAIGGAVGQSFTPTVSGNYAVALQNGSCSDTSSCYAVTVVGVPEADQGIALYPNPTSEGVTIDMGQVHQLVWVRVVDAQGKVLLVREYDSARLIQLELGQAAGLYTVQVGTSGGTRAYRVVKSK